MPSIPDLYPSVTFDANSPESERTIRFGSLTTKKYNEYNVMVIDTSDESVTGTVPGMISVDIYSPYADRPETTDNILDLSTNCRKFQIFKVTVNRAVFSVSGLGAGLRVVITAIRSSDGT